MKRSYLSLFLSGVLGYSSLACSQDYPLEFADFFEPRREKVEVVIVGTIRSELVDADVSYDFFQLPQQSNATEDLAAYFKRQRLTDAAVDLILGMLSKGVVANPNCDTVLSACVPKDEPGKPEFVFDFDNKQLRIFLSTDMFSSFDNEVAYFSPASEHGALVNWSNLYLYADEDNYNLNWNNDTTLGLPVGYLSINTQLHQSSNEQEFNLFRAVYSYEMDDYRAIVGYQDQNAMALNSTDFLSYGADYTGVAASVGSSTNLLKGDAKAQQRLYFYATQGGQLEVYQGDRLLLSQVVSAGEQSIGYDRLPVGTYQVTLRLKQGGQVVLEEQRQVVNSRAFSLPVGQWDYRLEVGRLDDEDESAKNWWERPVEHRSYVRALSAYRPMESLLASSGLVSNGRVTQWLIGANWAPNSLVNAQYTLGLFSNGDNYQFGQLNIAPFSLSARAVTHQDLKQPSDLTRLLYGADDFREYGAGVGGGWGGGRTFI
ncbi:TcfC E-set like domain-containing protein, partial [Vibrio vulnificus]|uniref:TcfC E-set like domain-containing protein n=1 Tax=Vibrio vulnificus TaxID=672 RepID=UPI0010D2DCC0